MKTYWVYQLAGWSVFAAIGLVINILNGGYVPGLIAGHILFVFYGIGLTHLFRGPIQRLQSKRIGRVRRIASSGWLYIRHRRLTYAPWS